MQAQPHIFIGSDHAGFTLKNTIARYLQENNYTVTDLGAQSTDSCDYPASAQSVAKAVLENNGMGILICGTGIGMSVSANRFPGIRAALCTHEFHAKASREHRRDEVRIRQGRRRLPQTDPWPQ